MPAPLPPELLALIAAGGSLPSPLPTEPMGLFAQWLREQTAEARQPNPNAMCLATLGLDGAPRSRIVLCRGVDTAQGFIVFYTNYRGGKGKELAVDARASATFHWDHAELQVRIEGQTVKSPAEESDAYFKRRAWQSRLGAWASHQSEPVASREALLAQYAVVIEQLKLTPDQLLTNPEAAVIPRPLHWGGFRLWASRVELWMGGGGRMHDRAVWERELDPAADGFAGGPWRSTRLQP